MKTTNNVQKTASRTAAVIVSLVLISLTVTAQDFWKKVLASSSFNQIALAVVETPKTTEESKTAGMPNTTMPAVISDYDSMLTVENWMADKSRFSPKAESFITEPDKTLQVEEWMMNDELFTSKVDTDAPLTIEKWMTSEETWN